MKVFKELYNYRQLLKSNVRKEIRGRYKASFLGVLWSFINPLLMTLVYAIVFPLILKNTSPNYVVFIVVAIIPWNFFTTVISQGTNTILMNANLVKKVYFPREILPLSVAISGVINFFISCFIILIFVIIYGIGISPYILLIPVVAFVQFLFSLGIIFILSAIDVYVRDVEYIVNFIIMMVFYGTPILYDISSFQDKKWILELNPMTHIINAYRDIWYHKTMIDLQGLGIVAIISVILVIVGYKIFKHLERGFAEEL